MKRTPKSLFPWAKEIDITTEEWREYVFPHNEIVKIVVPQILVVSDNGHRVIDGEGVSHYIPYGWIHLFWKSKEGKAKYYYQRKKP